jgi:hypothetical protein
VPRPSSPLSAKASTRCPSRRSMAGDPGLNRSASDQPASRNPPRPAANPRTRPQPEAHPAPLRPGLQLTSSSMPKTSMQKTSMTDEDFHEDTSPDGSRWHRRPALGLSTLARPAAPRPVRLGRISPISVHPVNQHRPAIPWHPPPDPRNNPCFAKCPSQPSDAGNQLPAVRSQRSVRSAVRWTDFG